MATAAAAVNQASNTRITIYRDKNDKLLMQRERLTKQPAGSSAERRKALKSGWQPDWVKAGQPASATVEPIYSDVEIVGVAEQNATMRDEYVRMAAATVQAINRQITNFKLDPPKRVLVTIQYMTDEPKVIHQETHELDPEQILPSIY